VGQGRRLIQLVAKHSSTVDCRLADVVDPRYRRANNLARGNLQLYSGTHGENKMCLSARSAVQDYRLVTTGPVVRCRRDASGAVLRIRHVSAEKGKCLASGTFNCISLLL
jgi:hypothetical protein